MRTGSTSTSLDMFGRLIDRLPHLRALLVVTFRPEFVAPWASRAHVAVALPQPLRAFGMRWRWSMASPVARRCQRRSWTRSSPRPDGVPLFVEELTKTVLESGLLREARTAYLFSTTG